MEGKGHNRQSQSEDEGKNNGEKAWRERDTIDSHSQDEGKNNGEKAWRERDTIDSHSQDEGKNNGEKAWRERDTIDSHSQDEGKNNGEKAWRERDTIDSHSQDEGKNNGEKAWRERDTIDSHSQDEGKNNGEKAWRERDTKAQRVIAPSGDFSRPRPDARTENGGQKLLHSGTQSRVRMCHFRHGRQMVEERETRRQVVGMLATVVLLFALCWAPILTNNVLTAWGYLHPLHYGYLKPMRQAFFLLSYLNSCLNPVVYAFFSHNFRQSFKLAICACLRGKAFVRAYRYSLSATTNSTRHSSSRYQCPVSSSSNGRGGMVTSGTALSLYEREMVGSEMDMTRSPTSYSCSSPEVMELYKLSP
ncbi:hypothetical protein ACOMHN_015740 [Nucella lapillus]